MIQMGQTVPLFRLPLLVQGQLRIVDSRHLHGRWTAICYANSLSLQRATFLELHMDRLHRERTSLLAVTSHLELNGDDDLSRLSTLALPIVVDTLKRVHRAFHVSWAAFRTNCNTFLVDPEGFLRFHLIHGLSQRGMTALRTIVEEKRRLWERRAGKEEDRRGTRISPSLDGVTRSVAATTVEWENR